METDQNNNTSPAYPPLPWDYDNAHHPEFKLFVYSGHQGLDGAEASVCAIPDRLNANETARFIVRACNAHDELVAALDNLLSVTLDQDLAQGIELTEEEQEARKMALSVLEKADAQAA